MPQITQLPVATGITSADVLPLVQDGQTMQLPLATLLAGSQPLLTLASNVLLGRISTGAGGPEPIAIGTGLSLANGELSVSGVTGPQGPLGPQGAQGLPGPIGATGASLLSGTFTPDATVGQDGDTYLNGANGNLYRRVAGVWNIIGNFTGQPGQSLWTGTVAAGGRRSATTTTATSTPRPATCSPARTAPGRR